MKLVAILQFYIQYTYTL